LGLFIILHDDVMMDWGTAIHGSHYDYDRRVPMAFIGRGIGGIAALNPSDWQAPRYSRGQEALKNW
jgi:hypothetical protein